MPTTYPQSYCAVCTGASTRATALEGISMCLNCHTYLNNRSHSRAAEEAFYTSEQFTTDRAAGTLQLGWLKRYLGGAPVGSLLDFGCGTGQFLALARNQGWNVSGLEINEQSARMAAEATGGNVFCGSFYDFQGRADGFDVITMWDSLDHLLEPDVALQRVYSWLKPGGLVFIRVRNGPVHYAARVVQGYARRWGLSKHRYAGVIHRYGFCVHSLGLLAKRTGFSHPKAHAAPILFEQRKSGRKGLLRNFFGLLVTGLTSLVFTLSARRFYPFASILLTARKPE